MEKNEKSFGLKVTLSDGKKLRRACQPNTLVSSLVGLCGLDPTKSRPIITDQEGYELDYSQTLEQQGIRPESEVYINLSADAGASTNSHIPVWLLLDDSNLWIEGKKLAAKLKHFPEEAQDPRWRIDVGRLADWITSRNDGGDNMIRVIQEAHLFGSEPPPVDTVWKNAQKKNWKLFTAHRKRNAEKQVDCAIAVTATEILCNNHGGVLVLFSGDEDMVPIINKAAEVNRKYNKHWRVEVYMWNSAIANVLRNKNAYNKDAPSSDYTCVVLDKYIDEFGFTEWKFKLGLEEEGTRILVGFATTQEENYNVDDDELRPEFLAEIQDVVRLPFSYAMIDHGNNNDEIAFALVFSASNMRESAIRSLKNVGTLNKVITWEAWKQSLKDYAKAYDPQTLSFKGLNDSSSETNNNDDDENLNDQSSFDTVKYKKSKKVRQKWSKPCDFHYHCVKPCTYYHTEEEINHVKELRNAGYDDDQIKNYRKEKCNKSSGSKCKLKCTYYHHPAEAICFKCHIKGHPGGEQCPNK